MDLNQLNMSSNLHIQGTVEISEYFIKGPFLIFALLVKDDGFIHNKDLIESYKH